VAFTPAPATLQKITIGNDDFKSQGLPIDYVSSWPVWMAAPDGSAVTRLPDATSDGDMGWVNPNTFEQLWLPTDLPALRTRAAIGVVLKNGVPRYLFPCVETTVTTANGQIWHNRGINSLPLGKTWLVFGEVPADDLRLSCYRSEMPPTPPQPEFSEEGEALVSGIPEAIEETAGDWQPVLPLTGVSSAIDTLMKVIGNGPDELGDGFCFLVAPVQTAGGGDVSLPAEAMQPGQRLRLFLSDVDATPTSLDPEDRAAWLWKRGECDLGIYNVAAGGESEYLPQIYWPLYSRCDGVGFS
jgi:hypothetical protein